MASIIVETPGKPWGYYRDMTRQLWDEARHAMMGEVGVVANGVDWTEARVTHNWSLRLNTECTPIERHAVLYFIEQGLSKILSNWAAVKEQGLTEHANWWPAIYRQACVRWGIEPNPKALAFAETYEGQRADRKKVAVSG